MKREMEFYRDFDILNSYTYADEILERARDEGYTYISEAAHCIFLDTGSTVSVGDALGRTYVWAGNLLRKMGIPLGTHGGRREGSGFRKRFSQEEAEKLRKAFNDKGTTYQEIMCDYRIGYITAKKLKEGTYYDNRK